MNGNKARDLRRLAIVLFKAGDIEDKVTPKEVRRGYRSLKKGYQAELKTLKQIENGRR